MMENKQKQMKKISGKSPAKINLTLDIFSREKNEKLHKIKSVMSKISLSDKMTLELSDEFILLGNFSCETQNNLIFKAWNFVQNFYSIKQPVKVIVEKNIPEQAGLGGGSSNFATFIKLYAELLELEFSWEKMITEVQKFGSDIPFFMNSAENVLIENYGEKMTKLNFELPENIWIYLPSFQNSTEKMYDELTCKNTNFTEQFLSEKNIEKTGNAFDEFLSKKEYQDIFGNKFSQENLKKIHLSGSGSAMWSYEDFNLSNCKKIKVQQYKNV